MRVHTKLKSTFLPVGFPETLKVINGTDRCSGRVEVFHNGRWGKVCTNNWSIKETMMVCKELGCGAPKKSQDGFNFGDSALPGFISRCSTSVSILGQCAFEEHMGTCDGASVACTGEIQK